MLLNASSNHLVSLPDSINELSHLSALDVRHNQLTALPAFTGPTKLSQHLKILIVADNALTKFPDSLCNLTALEHLNAEHNKLVSLPTNLSIHTLPSLKVLRLRENELAAIPFAVGTFGGGSSGVCKLQTFDVRSNPLVPEMGAMLNVKLDGGGAATPGAATSSTAASTTGVVHKSLLDFLRQGYAQGYDASTRVKLMALGDANAGKSTLLKTIQSILSASKKKTVAGPNAAGGGVPPRAATTNTPVTAAPAPAASPSPTSAAGGGSAPASDSKSPPQQFAVAGAALVRARPVKKSLSIDVCARDGIQWVMFDFPGMCVTYTALLLCCCDDFPTPSTHSVCLCCAQVPIRVTFHKRRI